MSKSDLKTVLDLLDNLEGAELDDVRAKINDRMLSQAQSRQGSADVSADDEKKKYIAQHGDNPNAQLRAQDVPEPESNEVKDLQNEAALAEHQALSTASDDDKSTVLSDTDHGTRVTHEQNKKLS